jgi:dienelactone hydrolase
MRRLMCFVFAILCCGGVQAETATLEKITTPRGVTQPFILIKPAKPKASVILFAGGHGGLGLKSASSMAWGGGNFLVRTRDRFAAQDLMVAVVDAPSDHAGGMNAQFRMSPQHAADIEAVASFLKRQADVPVWVVGTSMGTFSAANAALADKSVAGLVLTSTISRAKPDWKIKDSYPRGVGSMPLPNLAKPALILAHRKDGCDLSPADGAPMLKGRLAKSPRVDVVLLDGGDPPRSDACEAFSQHGYLGIEGTAVSAISRFITAGP